MPMTRSPSFVAWSLTAVFSLSFIAPNAHGQWDNPRKKRGFSPCFIRPDVDPPSVLGVGGLTRCGRPASVPAPAVLSPFGSRSFGWGTILPGGTFGNRFCGPRSLTVSAPAYCQEPVFYPSANLGQCTSGAFYQPREINLYAASSVLTSQPPSVFINNTNYVASTDYGIRTSGSGGGDRAVSEALTKFKQTKHAAVTKPRAPESIAPPTVRSEAEAREIEAILDRGDQQFRVGNYYGAREEYTRALVMAGEDPGVRIAYGMSETALGHYQEASRAFRQAAAVQPILDPESIDLSQAYARPSDF